MRLLALPFSDDAHTPWMERPLRLWKQQAISPTSALSWLQREQEHAAVTEPRKVFRGALVPAVENHFSKGSFLQGAETVLTFAENGSERA